MNRMKELLLATKHSFTPILYSVYFQSVTGIWTPGVDDATCVALNHKYKLMAFGRKK